jgi:ATP-dependent Clp protease adapter protein ClpS
MIRMTGFGGLCLIETRRRARDAFVVYSAGLLAQAAVFVVTLVAIHWTDSIVPPLIEDFAFSLIGTNALLFLISLIPSTSPDGLNSDGRVLLRLARDRRDGKAFIGVQFEGTKQGNAAPVFPPETSVLSIRSFAPKGFEQGLEILNDSRTPFDFVIGVFTRHLGWEATRAVRQAIDIHNQGGALLPIPSLEEAEQIAAAVAREAAEAGHTFICRAVAT